MKKIILLGILGLSCISFFSNAQNNFSYSPEKPKAGDLVTIKYNPANTPLGSSKNIVVLYSLYSVNSPGAFHIEDTYLYPMKKEGNNWVIKIELTGSTELVAVKFREADDETVSDNKGGSGYFIRTYDSNGNETTGSVLGYASAINSWATLQRFVARDAGTSLELMKDVFTIHPELKIKYLMDWLGALNSGTPENEKQEVMKNEIEEFAKSDQLTDEDYTTLVNYYKNLKMTEKADGLRNNAIKKFPKGKLAYNTMMSEINAEKDLSKKKKLAIEAQKKFTEFGKWEIRPYGAVLSYFIEQKDPAALKKWWNFIKDKNWSGVESYGYFARNLNEGDIGLDIVADISERGKKLWENERTNPQMKRTSYVPKSQEDLVKARDEAYLYVEHAKALIQLKRKDEALAKYQESFSLYPVKRFAEEEIKNYVKFMLELKKYEIAKPIIEEAIQKGIFIDGMKEALQVEFVKKNSNEAGFDDYYNAIIEKGKIALAEKQKKLMINQPAPQFALMDLSGKQVSLSDYKGKVVVLDFWATWCGPCKAAFPAMQKTINKYKDNNDVVFLFINTFQKEIDKKKNAEDYIKETQYTFQVLLDNEDKMAADFKVSAIPTKFIIDKNGNIRFNVMGAETGDTAVESLSSMIELAGQ